MDQALYSFMCHAKILVLNGDPVLTERQRSSAVLNGARHFVWRKGRCFEIFFFGFTLAQPDLADNDCSHSSDFWSIPTQSVEGCRAITLSGGKLVHFKVTIVFTKVIHKNNKEKARPNLYIQTDFFKLFFKLSYTSHSWMKRWAVLITFDVLL